MRNRISIALLSLLLSVSLIGTAQAQDTIIEWDGGCYNSQVYGLGNMTLVKTHNGDNYDVVLIGLFSIYSPTYGYVRQELPPGFLPNTYDRALYQCEEAINGGEQRPVSLAQGIDDIDQAYENGAIWFPEKFYNGRYDLTCRWKTDQPDPPVSAWQSCPSITIKSLTETPTPEPAPRPTPTFAPTAPAMTPTSENRIFIPFTQAALCLPAWCN